jgi:hypothetical protein
MTTTFAAQRAASDHCGRRITLFECLWRELPGVELRASYAVDLHGRQHASSRLRHVDCLVAAALAMPAPALEHEPPALAA